MYLSPHLLLSGNSVFLSLPLLTPWALCSISCTDNCEAVEGMVGLCAGFLGKLENVRKSKGQRTR